MIQTSNKMMPCVTLISVTLFSDTTIFANEWQILLLRRVQMQGFSCENLTISVNICD